MIFTIIRGNHHPMNSGNETTEAQIVGTKPNEFDALQTIITALRPLDVEARQRILDSASTFLGITNPIKSGPAHFSTPQTSPSPNIRAPFSEDTSMSPKDFLNEKSPKTDVERIACLAYYLTHYRSMPHFKTLELSVLNTEAAQPKFSNTTYSSNNAVKLGYIVPSTKGQRQLSALGERFVQALPDREAAKNVLVSMRRKTRAKRKRPAANESPEE
jgi:hypothetical protein